MKILMVASEAGPFVRTGGLGDVMAALPSALAALGHDVKVFLPRYQEVDERLHRLQPLSRFVAVPHGGDIVEAQVLKKPRSRRGAEHFFVGHDEYFLRPELYRDPDTGEDYEDNHLRFAFFSRAVLQTVKALNWSPDIVHVHDWQAALVPVYLKTLYARDAAFANARSVLTIHNLGYQGLFEKQCFADLGLPEELFYAMTGALEFFGRVNFLKGGIALADKITTVSERYAHEIQAGEEFGFGLEGVLRDRSKDIKGILNGVDYTLWSPSRDNQIPKKYGPSNLSGKRTCRVELMNDAGLPIRDRVPLAGLITRLADQKGIDLLTEAADEIFAMNLQMIVLGTGDEEYHDKLRKLEGKYPDKLKVYLEFNDGLAHRIQAGADIFLMPSRYEPCGLNQMYALKYGTVPVVRKVGGLADTVEDYDPSAARGTGFVFEEYTSEAMLEALSRALEVFAGRRKWGKVMKTGMSRDFSWGRSAREYSEFFATAISVDQPAGTRT
ncbi:MAG: glycogen synthase GlgA [bacterium]|nr:glycogen synthase GlgA [bacterium]